MLLQLSTTHHPATDLGFLLGKNPASGVQSFDLSFGRAHAFYPETSPEKCTFALLLEVDPVALVRGKNGGDGPLSQYVNDRPYAATSHLSVAIAQTLRSALLGKSHEKAELAATEIPLRAVVSSVPASESALRRLFEPLGYEIELEKLGERHHHLTLQKTSTLSELLSHLYVLIPVLDGDKHYFVAADEVEKLLRHGQKWLEAHPQRDFIVGSYLKKQPKLVREALSRLRPLEADEEAQNEEEARVEKPLSLHEIRLQTVVSAFKNAGARRILDLGCGEGRLIRELLKDPQFEFILGLDASHKVLDFAAEKLRLERAPARIRERVSLVHGALTYRDARMEGFDGAALVEVIEHLDPARLGALERVVFEFARPKTVVVTTPNVEYNAVWESLPAGKMRHRDHRFEWNRAQFGEWAQKVATRFGYEVTIEPLGPLHDEFGAPSQMATFCLEISAI